MERVPGLPELFCQPGPGLPFLGQHSSQPLGRGKSSLCQPHSTTAHADGGSPVPQGHRKSLGGSEAEAKPMKYCCVYLPDSTASLASVRPGLSIRDMLAGICEKRGFSPSDIKVYLVGNEQVQGRGAPASKAGVAWMRPYQEHHDFALAESTGVGPGVLCAGRPRGEVGEQDKF